MRYGKFYAASNPFSVTVYGKGAHAAKPEEGIDALGAAVEMVNALNTLPREDFVLSVCTMQAGHAENIIADKAVFSGVLRTLGKQKRTEMKQTIYKIITDIAAKRDLRAEVNIINGYPGIVNHDSAVGMAEQAAVRLFGSSAVHRLERPTMTTEDFGFFIDNVPGCYYHIGVGGDAPLHSPAFCPDERALVTAAAMQAELAYHFLKTQE